MKCVGGPWDGQDRERTADIIAFLDGSGRYVAWRDWAPDPDWWMRGLAEPLLPEEHYRWQGPGEFRDPPMVEAIKATVREASADLLDSRNDSHAP